MTLATPEQKILKTVPAEALDAAVTGVGLSPGTLREQLDESLTLLVFLRHFGCMFCREAVSDLREAAETHSDFPKVIFSPSRGQSKAEPFCAAIGRALTQSPTLAPRNETHPRR